MKSTLVAATVAALLSVCVARAADSRLDSAKAGSYEAEPSHTQVGFSISHFGFTHYAGLFSGATGTLQLDPTRLAAARLDVSIPIDSITTTSPELTAVLKGDKWFDVARFPQANFVSTQVVPRAQGATVTGNLTLHGVTRPVVLQVRFVGAGVNPLDKAYTVGFEATGAIKRSDFGVTAYLPALGDEVQLNIAGAFEQQK